MKSKSPRTLLIIASIFTIVMAIPHFFVPFIFPWEQLIDGLYSPIKWALFAMNIFYSFLLLWAGVLSFICAIKPNISQSIYHWINGGIGLFWLIGAIYEIIIPFPINEARWILPCMAFFISILYGVSIVKYNKPQDGG